MTKQANEHGHYQCAKCHQWKSPMAFNEHILSSNGLQSQCKDCQSIYNAVRYQRAKARRDEQVRRGL